MRGHHRLQARLVPRPVRLRPQLPVTPCADDRAARPEPRPSDGDCTPIPTQTGSNDIPRTLHFHPFDLLKAINRPIGGEHYERLRAALGRLQTTTIRTNIRAKGSRRLRQFSWIEGY